jgi:hypothetical protein
MTGITKKQTVELLMKAGLPSWTYGKINELNIPTKSWITFYLYYSYEANDDI